MHYLLVIKELKKLLETEEVGVNIAEEALTMVLSAFPYIKEYTIRLEKKGERKFFYSTLPEDEAHYWDCSYVVAKEERSIADKDIILIHLPEFGNYGGFLAVKSTMKVFADEKEVNILWLLQLFLCACLSEQEVEKNRLIDPVTGLGGNKEFQKELERRMKTGREGYLVVARTSVYYEKPFHEESLDRNIKRLAKLCREEAEKDSFRIAADMIAVMLDGEKDNAIIKMQNIMNDMPDSVIFLLPYEKVILGSIFTHIQKEMNKMILGERSLAAMINPYPKLPIFSGKEAEHS